MASHGTTDVWLKLSPRFDYTGRLQTGWKVVGVSQKQPAAGYTVHLQLTVPFPQLQEVTFEPDDVQLMTDNDVKNRKIVRGLDIGAEA